MTEQKRDGNTIPFDRSGMPKGRTKQNPLNGPDLGSIMEANAPEFKSVKEHSQWLDGKPTRRELHDDFKRNRDGLVYLTSRIEELDSKLHALLRVMAERGTIEPKHYQETVTLQVNFKRLLDSINFDPGRTLDDKIDAAISWNSEHPEMKIHGGYIRGLHDYLKKSDTGLTLLRRAEIASELLIPEEDVLSDDELAELEKELLAKPIEIPSSVIKETTDEPSTGEPNEPSAENDGTAGECN